MNTGKQNSSSCAAGCASFFAIIALCSSLVFLFGDFWWVVRLIGGITLTGFFFILLGVFLAERDASDHDSNVWSQPDRATDVPQPPVETDRTKNSPSGRSNARDQKLEASLEMLEEAVSRGAVDVDTAADFERYLQNQLDRERSTGHFFQLELDLSPPAPRDATPEASPQRVPERTEPPEELIPSGPGVELLPPPDRPDDTSNPDRIDSETDRSAEPQKLPTPELAPADTDPVEEPDSESLWTDVIQPLLVENWLLFVGAFLIVASGAYFLSIVWEGLSSLMRTAISFGAITGTATGFAWAGRYVRDQWELDGPQRTLWAVGVGLLTSAAPIAGLVAAQNWGLGLVCIAVSAWCGFSISSRYQPDGTSDSANTVGLVDAGLFVLLGLSTGLGEQTPLLGLALMYIAVTTLWQLVRASEPSDDEASRPTGALLAQRAGYTSARLGQIASRLTLIGPPFFITIALLGVVTTQFWLSNTLASVWPAYGGLVAVAALAIQDYGRRGDDSAVVYEVLAVGISLTGIVIGLSEPSSRLLATTIATCVAWRATDELPGKYVVAYGSILFAYAGALDLLGTLLMETVNTGPSALASRPEPYLVGLLGLVVRRRRLSERKQEYWTNATATTALAWALFAWTGFGGAWSVALTGTVAAVALFELFVDTNRPIFGYVGAILLSILSVLFGFKIAEYSDLAYLAPVVFVATLGLICTFVSYRLERDAGEYTVLTPDAENLFASLNRIATDTAVAIGFILPFLALYSLYLSGLGVPSGGSSPLPLPIVIVSGGLTIYSATLLWQTHRTGSKVLGYSTVALVGLFGGIFIYGVKTLVSPESSGLSFAVAGLVPLALYELSTHVAPGARNASKRSALMGVRIEAPRPELWTGLLQNFAYLIVFPASIAAIGIRSVPLVPRTVTALSLAIAGARAVSYRPTRRISYAVLAASVLSVTWTWVPTNLWGLFSGAVFGALAGQLVMYAGLDPNHGASSKPEVEHDREWQPDSTERTRGHTLWNLGSGSFVLHSLCAALTGIAILVTATPTGLTFPAAAYFVLFSLIPFAVDQLQRPGKYSAIAFAVQLTVLSFYVIAPALQPVTYPFLTDILVLHGFWLVAAVALKPRTDEASERHCLYSKVTNWAVALFTGVGVATLAISLLATTLVSPIGTVWPALCLAPVLSIATYAFYKTRWSYLSAHIVLLIWPVGVASVLSVPDKAGMPVGLDVAPIAYIWAGLGVISALSVRFMPRLLRSSEIDGGDDGDLDFKLIETRPWTKLVATHLPVWRIAAESFMALAAAVAVAQKPAIAAGLFALIIVGFALLTRRGPVSVLRKVGPVTLSAIGLVASIVLFSLQYGDAIYTAPGLLALLSIAAAFVIRVGLSFELPPSAQSDAYRHLSYGLAIAPFFLLAIENLTMLSARLHGSTFQYTVYSAALTFLAGFWVTDAYRNDRHSASYLGLGSVVGLYAYARGAIELGHSAFDPWVLTGLASVFMVARKLLENLADETDALERSLALFGLALPISGLIVHLVGSLPDPAVTGPAIGTAALFCVVYGYSIKSPFAMLGLPIAVLLCGTIPEIGVDFDRPATHGVYLTNIIALTAAWLRQLVQTERQRYAYGTVGMVLSGYVYIRIFTGLGALHYDPWVINGFAVALVGLDRFFGRALLKRAILVWAGLLPLAALGLAGLNPSLPIGQLWGVSSLLYVLLGWHFKKKGLYIPAALFLNLELFEQWLQMGASHPLFFTVPVAITFLGLARLFKNELTAVQQKLVRGVGLATLYVPGLPSLLSFESMWAVIAVTLLAIGGIFTGILMRIRSYLYVGAATLVLTIGTNLFRAGMQDRMVGTLILFVLGLSSLGAGIYYSARRDQIKRKYRQLKRELATWD